MNFIFFGNPGFSAIILEKLIEAGFIPAAVVCSPDKPVGRKKIVTPPPVKSLIMGHRSWTAGIKPEILQPENLSSISYRLKDKSCSFAIVAAYPKIIPKEIIELFPKGIIVVHPSLLPKYRGASPIQSALLNGEKATGTSLFLIDEQVDHGPVLATEELKIDETDNYSTLQNKLAELSAGLLVEILPEFIAGEIEPREQNHELATFTKKFKTEDGFVEFEEIKKALAGESGPACAGRLAEKINNKIRAFSEEPVAWTTINNRRVKLLESKVEDGRLVLISVLPEGKNKIKWAEFQKNIK